jgi:tetratricopeptide (TPR) repeat protein
VHSMEGIVRQHRGGMRPDWNTSISGGARSAACPATLADLAANVPQHATFLGHVQHQVAAAYRHAGRLEEAEVLYRRALELNPYYFHSHWGLSAVCLRKHDFSAALEHFRGALALDRESLVFELMDAMYIFVEDRPGMEQILARLKSNALYKKITLSIKKAIAFCVRAIS